MIARLDLGPWDTCSPLGRGNMRGEPGAATE
jgi:hypothetical protein